MSKPPSIRRSLSVGMAAALIVFCVLLFFAIISRALVSDHGKPERYIALVLLFFSAIAGCVTAYGNWILQVQQFRRDNGLCIRCGYDLRATPDRCPECGRPVRRRQAAPGI